MLCQTISKTNYSTAEQYLITSTKWKPATFASNPFTFTILFASCTALVSFSTIKLLKT